MGVYVSVYMGREYYVNWYNNGQALSHQQNAHTLHDDIDSLRALYATAQQLTNIREYKLGKRHS